MEFDSFDAFLVMGGHGSYIWACYIVFFALSLVLIQWSRTQRRAVLHRLARRQAGLTTAGPIRASNGKASADFARVESLND
jgi:heme exporter protein D